MRFEVLGPLRVVAREREVPVTAGRERAVLAALLLHADRPVPVEQLIEVVWSAAPPRSARNQLQACVSQLRRRLGDAITTDPAGYRLRIDPGKVDVHRFRELLAEARAAVAGARRAQARDRYRAALELWRGPALAGVENPELSRAAAALEEERAQALQECLEVELALGRAGELIGELTELVQRYPYREALHATLMRALYRAGRPADALAAFRQARQVLHDELGTEPGEELQRLHHAILNRDPELGAAAEPPPAAAQVPHELPAEASCFVGRAHEIGRVRGVLVPPDRGALRRPPVAVLYGPGGIGKSALAVRVAHELAGEFPDGQLYVDLCGSTPGMRPVPAVEVLGRFLRRFGVAPDQIPPGEAEAAALFRSVTAGRRLLLVLDNAADKDQVAALVPASPSCATLVTSRYPLPTLDADDRLRVGVLDDTDGLALLSGLAGGKAAEGDAARSIVSLSGGLPLAIRVAAGRLASRPDLPATEYAQRLADGSRRLDELQLDDLAVRACIRTGYDALRSDGDPAGERAARAFRMLGILQVPDVAPGVVAAMLAEPDLDVARAALDRLVDAQLVEPVAGGRYRLHDLVRLVATEFANEVDLPDTRDDVITRAVSYYTGGLWNADAKIQFTRTLPFGGPPISADLSLPTFDGSLDATRWVDAEMPSLLGALAQATTLLDTTRQSVLWLGDALWIALDVRCEWRSAARLSRLVLHVGEERGDKELAACGLLLCGRSEACLGNYSDAIEYLQEAREVLSHLGNQVAVAVVLNGLGITYVRRGEATAALRQFQAALEAISRSDTPDLRSTVLNNLTVGYAKLGRLDHAVDAVTRSLRLGTAGPRDAAIASRLLNLAAAECLRGNHAAATRWADEALSIGRSFGDRIRECEALIVRSDANRRSGALSDAAADAREALLLAEAYGYQYVAASAWTEQAKVLGRMGHAKEAEKARVSAEEAHAQLSGTSRDPMIELLLASDDLA